jgi:hypothetical protein
MILRLLCIWLVFYLLLSSLILSNLKHELLNRKRSTIYGSECVSGVGLIDWKWVKWWSWFFWIRSVNMFTVAGMFCIHSCTCNKNRLHVTFLLLFHIVLPTIQAFYCVPGRTSFLCVDIKPCTLLSAILSQRLLLCLMNTNQMHDVSI